MTVLHREPGWNTVPDAEPVEWAVSAEPVDYLKAVAAMEARVAAIAKGQASELVWLLEHPSLYTAGTSAHPDDLLASDRFPVFSTGRGGQYTYHGPGQRVVYTLFDLRRRGGDVRAFVGSLERWLISVLARFDVFGETRRERVGVWVPRQEPFSDTEDKIAAIGIRVRQGVSFHGFSLNVSPELEHFSGIVPCGVSEHGVTSLVDLGHTVTMQDVDQVLADVFEEQFGQRTEVAPLL